VKRTTKHGATYMKQETPARRKLWKAHRRKMLRQNDKYAMREQT
jgi:hypothetical protein